MLKNWKRLAICAAIALGGLGLTQLFSYSHFVELLNLKAYDAQFLVRGKRPVSNIVIVAMDDKTLNTFPELQAFWHPYYADAIHAASDGGAKVVAFDVAFGIPVTKYAPDNDRILAEAVIGAPIPAIVGYVPALLAKQKDWPVPVNMIASTMGLGAFSNLTVDSDDFVRRQEMIEAAPSDKSDVPLARSFALRIAEKYLGTDATFDHGHLSLQGHEIPLDANRAVAINFAGPPDSFPVVSLSDFLAAYKSGDKDRLKNWVDGRIVLVGPDSVDDRYPTPYYTSFSSAKWTTTGVEIHANALSTILSRDFITPAASWARLLTLFLVAVATVGIAFALRAGFAALGLLVTLAIALASTQLAFRSGWILPAAELFLCWLLCFIGATVYRFVAAEKRRDLFRQAVSLFVGKKLATTLDNTQRIMLSGSRQSVTVLFTDIRGFTAFCEEKDPAVVVDLLNTYMQVMVAIVVKYHGHVNKFIGDGILAIFSDEDGTPAGDHPIRAVRCATEMVTVPGQFKTGAGLHSGPVVVGNVGSQDKMEYTVLGDTVNLASRLESLNKENKTSLLMSGVTHDLLNDQVETHLLGTVPVRGKAVPIDLYTVKSLMPKQEALAGAEQH